MANGFICGCEDGRADTYEVELRSGSYVLPAYVVAAMGSGNSLAGACVLQEIFFPQPPSTNGHATRTIPTLISAGEYVVGPEVVRAVGDGNHKLGYARLHEWVIAVRDQWVRSLQATTPSTDPYL